MSLMERARSGSRFTRVVRVAVLVGVMTVTFAGSSASPAEGNQPGLLAPGTYPLRVASAGTAGAEQPGSLVVERSGALLLNTYNLVTDTAHMTLQRMADGSVRVIDFDVAGIYFPATSSSGDLWRPAPDLVGAMPSPMGFGWSRKASNGGDITLSQSSTISGVKTSIGSNGLAIRTQRVDSTLTFTGGVTGEIKVSHIEVVSTPTKFLETWNGNLNVGGTPKTVQIMMIMGNLGSFAG